jgi:hypothetical protein
VPPGTGSPKLAQPPGRASWSRAPPRDDHCLIPPQHCLIGSQQDRTATRTSSLVAPAGQLCQCRARSLRRVATTAAVASEIITFISGRMNLLNCSRSARRLAPPSSAVARSVKPGGHDGTILGNATRHPLTHPKPPSERQLPSGSNRSPMQTPLFRRTSEHRARVAKYRHWPRHLQPRPNQSYHR